MSLFSFTWIIGINADNAETVLALLASSIVNDFLLIMLLRTFSTNASVSILTLRSVWLNSVSISSAIDWK